MTVTAMNNLAAAADRASPMSYGRWGAKYSALVAMAGTAATSLMGGWDGPVKALVFFMALDLFSGFAAACREKQVDSSVMFWGGIGKGMVLLLVAAGVVLDRLLGLPEPCCRLAVIWFYVGREGLSVLENYGRLGLPLPALLGEVLRQVQDKGEQKQPAE